MTSGNTLFIRITAELMSGATYRVNIESGAVVPLLSCPQQPGQTGLVLSADFEWTFTAGVCVMRHGCMPCVWLGQTAIVNYRIWSLLSELYQGMSS